MILLTELDVLSFVLGVSFIFVFDPLLDHLQRNLLLLKSVSVLLDDCVFLLVLRFHLFELVLMEGNRKLCLLELVDFFLQLLDRQFQLVDLLDLLEIAIHSGNWQPSSLA